MEGFIVNESFDFYYFYLNFRIRNYDYCKQNIKHMKKDKTVYSFGLALLSGLDGDSTSYNSYMKEMISSLIKYDKKEMSKISDNILLLLGMTKDVNMLNFNNLGDINKSRSAYDYYYYLDTVSHTPISSFATYELATEEQFKKDSEFSKLMLLKKIKQSPDNTLLYVALAKLYKDSQANLACRFIAAYYGDIDSMNHISKIYEDSIPIITIILSSVVLLKIKKIENISQTDNDIYKDTLNRFYSVCDDSRIAERSIIDVFAFLIKNNNSAGLYGYYLFRKNSSNHAYLNKLLLEEFMKLENKAISSAEFANEYQKFKNAPFSNINKGAFDYLKSIPISLMDIYGIKEFNQLALDSKKVIDSLMITNNI